MRVVKNKGGKLDKLVTANCSGMPVESLRVNKTGYPDGHPWVRADYIECGASDLVDGQSAELARSVKHKSGVWDIRSFFSGSHLERFSLAEESTFD